MSTFLPVSVFAKSQTAWKSMQFVQRSPPIKGKGVSSAFSPQSVLSLPPVVYARLASRTPAVNEIDCWYSLTASVRALLKSMSARGLRTSIRPKLAGCAQTRLTNTSNGIKKLQFFGSSFAMILDAFFGAHTAHLSASLFLVSPVIPPGKTVSPRSVNTERLQILVTE